MSDTPITRRQAYGRRLHRVVIWRRLVWHELMTRLFRERSNPYWGKHELAAAEARARLFWDGIWIADGKPDNGLISCGANKKE